jgi:iron complex outermembrane receptor protein
MSQLRLVPVYLALCAAFPSAALAQETDEKILQTVKVTAARADGFVPTTVEAGSFRGADIMEVPSTSSRAKCWSCRRPAVCTMRCATRPA